MVDVFNREKYTPILSLIMMAFVSLVLSLLLFFVVSNVRGSSAAYDSITLNVSNLFPSQTCHKSKETRHNALRLIHADGPCSPFGFNGSALSLEDIIAADEARLASITTKFKKVEGTRSQESTSDLSIPIKNHGMRLLIEVGLGSPSISKRYVLMDTGSSLCWVHCKPCIGPCHLGYHEPFDPSKSTTYKRISMKECTKLFNGAKTTTATQVCAIRSTYGDNSTVITILSRETLTLTPTKKVKNFIFGCGHHATGLLSRSKMDGLFGMGRRSISLLGQLALTHGKVFSYCIPKSPDHEGHLIFGHPPAMPDRYSLCTPLKNCASYPHFYFVELLGVKVAGKSFPIFENPDCSTILDSGTTLTYLSTTTYRSLKSEFMKRMFAYKLIPRNDDLLCYDITGHNTITLPKIDLLLRDIQIVLSMRQTVFLFRSGINIHLCLAFRSNLPHLPFNIIGQIQQTSMEIVHDLTESQICFAMNKC